MTVQGTILNIERFAIHDGPGIRTVVFLKGCPLKCLWCSTVNGQLMSPEMEYYVEKCVGCKRCVEVCPVHAISVASTDEILTDRRLCDNCGKCVEVCPSGARVMAGEVVTVDEVIGKIERDTLFYSNSGGGVTLSGGEPTMQPEFSLKILKECKALGIHTAMETCGYTQWDILESLLKYLDLIYMDIKHISTEEHKRLTTKGNELILENARRIAGDYPDLPFIIRLPLIPGYNDSDENIASTAQFISQLNGKHKLELLPYHRLGIPKYQALSREYPLPEVSPPSDDHMHRLEEMVNSYGVEVQIGG
jgi:pyruvate formate lyase activating enzyme